MFKKTPSHDSTKSGITLCGIAVILALCALALPSSAANIDAREVARINNCTPKKIEISRQTVGESGSTTYNVECIIAKTKEEGAEKAPDSLLIKCKGSLCELLRPVKSGEK
ncbi:MAG: hypothetical protein PHX43_06915 [Alphaproteobacteria bacterium]|nr:hypothetical protein [Alphaproteobacteria bacterium]